MTAAHFAPTMARPSTRWLLLGSLALNLFFVGIALAMAVRPAPPPSQSRDRDIFVRTERLAAGLPQADANILRGEMNANRGSIEKTQGDYRSAQESIRNMLRKNPFDPDAMRAAMNETRAARQSFDMAVQTAFATAAARMSREGRVALANWRPARRDEIDKGPNR